MSKRLKYRKGNSGSSGQAKTPVAQGLTQGVSTSLARILRPQAAYRWMLPQLAAITPQYIELTLRGALAGSHVQAWELFDLMEDTWPRLRKNALEIKNGVRNLKAVYSAYREEEEEPTPSATEKMKLVSAALRSMRPDPAADENGFDGTVFDILDAWFKGVVVLETDWKMQQAGSLGQIIAPRSTYWVHPVCYAFDLNGRLGLRADNQGQLSPGNISTTSYQPMPNDVAEFPPNKFLIGICKTKSGTALGGALLRPLAWWWCAANFSADWLLNLAQVFGLPFRLANYDPNAPQATIDAICNMLQNMGSAGWAAFPAGTTIDLKEAKGNTDHSPQADMLDRSDKACDLLVLGQTLTSDSGGMGKGGGSLALGKVHAGVKAEIIAAAAKFVVDVMEGQLFGSILQLNYGTDDECPTLALVSEQEEDLVAKSSVVSVLAAAGAGQIIGLDWLGKTFNIPKPADGEKTLADAKAASAPKIPPAPGGGNDQDGGGEDANFAKAALKAGDGKFHGNQWVTVPDEHWTGSVKEMRDRATEEYRKHGPVDHAEIGKVTFSRQGTKTLKGLETPHEFQSVKALPEIVQKGKVVESVPDNLGRPEIKAWHTLHTGLQVGNDRYHVETLVKESTDGKATVNRFYMHRLKPAPLGGKESASGRFASPAQRPGRRPAGKSNIPLSAGNVKRLGEIQAIENDAEFSAALKAFAETL